ncbi:MAG: hypothetical protein WDM96_02935 [Lacunisphaera sp.]
MILHGQIPFRDAADNRTPLVPYLKAIVLAVAGEWNVRAIHITVALMLGCTAALLWQIGRALGRESAGVLAALCFFWLSGGLIPPVDGLTAHTGWFLIFFSALGFWLFTDAFNRTSRGAAMRQRPGLRVFLPGETAGLLDSACASSSSCWRWVAAIRPGHGACCRRSCSASCSRSPPRRPTLPGTAPSRT